MLWPRRRTTAHRGVLSDRGTPGPPGTGPGRLAILGREGSGRTRWFAVSTASPATRPAFLRPGLAPEQPREPAARLLRIGPRFRRLLLHLGKQLIDLARVEVDGVAPGAAVDRDSLVLLLGEVLAALRTAQLVTGQLVARPLQVAPRLLELTGHLVDARLVRGDRK